MGGSFFIGSRFTLSELAINIVSKASGSGFNDAESGLNRVDKAAKTATASLAGIGKDLTNVGKGLTAGITLPLLGIAAAAVKAGNELNTGMADVASLNLTSERVIELKENVKDLQIQFGKSAGDLTTGLYQVESAFGDTADTVNSLNLAVKAGVAGRASTSEALALISAETKGYGDTSLAAQQKVADLGLKTVELGKTTLPELSSSIGMVTSMSKQLGISQEELHAGASALSGVIGTTSQVFTGQRGVMQSLMAPTDTMTKLMKVMGYANGEQMVKGLGWAKTLQVITAASKASGLPLQSFIGSIEGQNYAMALSGDLLKKYNSDLEALGNSAGKTDAAYKAQTEGVNASGFAMQQAHQMLNVFLEDLNDALGPAFLAFMDMLEPATTALLSFSKSFSEMDPSTQKWIVGIAAAAAAIGPLLLVLGTFVTSISAALPVLASMGVIASTIAIPLGLLAIAYKINLFGLRDLVNNGFNRLRNAAPLAGTALRELAAQTTGFKIDTYDTTEGIQKFVAALTGSQSAGISAANWIGDVGYALGNVTAAAQKFATGADMQSAFSGVSTSVQSIKSAFSDLFTGNIGVDQFVAKISAALSGIPAMVRTLFSGTDFTALKSQIVTSLGLDSISFDFSKISEKVTTAIGSALSSVNFSTITTDFSNLPLWVSQKLSLVDWSTITTTFSLLTTQVSTKLDGINWSTITATFTTLTSAVATKISALDWSTVSVTFTGLTSWVSTKLSAIDWSTVTATFSGLTTAFDGFNTSLKTMTSEGGGITQVQTLVLGAIQGITNSLKGIDANQVASVGISFGGAITSLLSVFTTLSNLGNDNVGKATSAVSSLIQTVLGLATSFTTGLDATKISEGASKFVASYVDEISIALSSGNLPGIAGAASGLLKGITDQFANAMKGDAPKILGESFGGLANTIITQLGASLGGANVGKDVGKSVANIASGLGDAANGLAQGVADQLSKVDWSKFGGQIHDFVAGFMSSLNSELTKIREAGNKEQAKRQETGQPVYRSSSTGQPLSKEASATADALGKVPSAVGKFIDGLQLGTKYLPTNAIAVTGAGGGAGLHNLTPEIPKFVWPEYKPFVWPNYKAWIWSAYNAWTWPDYLTFSWPDYKTWSWPDIPTPAWLSSLLSWSPKISISGATSAVSSAVSSAYDYITGTKATNKANGTGSFEGGWSWVGERGPELMKLPRGTQIMSNYESSKYIANNAAGTTTAPPVNSGFSASENAAITKFAAAMEQGGDKAGKKIQKAMEKAAEQQQQRLESALGKVPGLFGTSEVTQKQLDMAKLGIPQNFADDYVRKLTDTVMNGKGWDGVDIKDAAMRAGIDPGLPAKVILDMVKEQWNDQSFFAGGKNTELINLDAVKAEIAKQQAQASGHASIMALFGIKSEDVTAQGGQLVDLLNQGIAGGMAGSGKGKDGKAQGNGIGTAIVAGAVADIKDSKVDAGGQLASALSAQLSGSTAFAGTGSAILQAIVDSWADATKSVDMLGGIAAALKIQVDSKDSVELLKNVGGRIAILLKQGIDDFFESSSVAESVSKSVNKATGTGGAGTGTPVADHKAIGTNSYAGGWSWVGESEPELLWIPPRAGVYPQRQMDQQRSGDTHIWNVTIANDIDVQSLAYKVSQIQQRKRG